MKSSGHFKSLCRINVLSGFLLVLVSALSLFPPIVKGQKLWSGTYEGGPGYIGDIFSIGREGNDYTPEFSFQVATVSAATPDYSIPLQASDGKIYIVTSGGGQYDLGTICSYSPVTGQFQVVFSFTGLSGNKPVGGLIQANNGLLYGVTFDGGANGYGTIFSFNISTGVYTKIHDFFFTNGSSPRGGLIQASNGLLYGLTCYGGSSNEGVLYSMNLNTNVYTKHVDFTGVNGRTPFSSLMQSSNGLLYGTTVGGGINDAGTIFSYNFNTNVLTTRYSFNNSLSGRYSYSKLVQASDGKLYGTTAIGGTGNYGTLYSWDETSAAYAVHHNFAAGTSANGAKPYGSLILAANGKLYGTTSESQTPDKSTLFSYNLSTATFLVEVQFSSLTHGMNARGGLLQASDGNIYGCAPEGGVSSFGTMYRYNPSSSVFTKLTDFYVRPDGANAMSGLIRGQDNKFYGMTSEGGTLNGGVIFRIDPLTHVYTVLHNFQVFSLPEGKLFQSANGLLYGLTHGGGSSGQGCLFSYNLSTGIYTVLVNFTGSNGRIPNGELIQLPNGKLYGFTAYGGSVNDDGVIFSYDPGTSTFTKHAEFTGPVTGKRPNGSFVLAGNGNLYGLAQLGGNGDCGSIFCFNPATNQLTTVHLFAIAEGVRPYGSLIKATNGKLYGLTSQGGLLDKGTIFSFDPAVNGFVTEYFLTVTTGESPLGSLYQAVDGKLYGMTNRGGTFNYGTVFRYDISGDSLTKLKDFNSPSGISPRHSSFIEAPLKLTTGSLPAVMCAGENINVPFTSDASAGPGNVYTVQLSDSNASFNSPVNIGFLNSASQTGSINVTIPSYMFSGSNYRFRVTASNPVTNGTDNGNGIMIKSLDAGISETMGSVIINQSVISHDTSGLFDNDEWIMSGNAVVDDNSPSNGYPGASGGVNVRLDANSNIDFIISGINTSGLNNIRLSFGVLKTVNNNSGSNYEVSYSTNGTTFTPLTIPSLPTGSGSVAWYRRTAVQNIPPGTNLSIRFRHFGTQGSISIDDVKIIYSLSTPVITSSGSTSFCLPDSVILSATKANSYLWSTGATTQTIKVFESGAYNCLVGSESGCTVMTNSVTVNADTCSAFLELKLFLESFYAGNGTMLPVLDPVNEPMVCDSITVELHSSLSPFEMMYTLTGIIDTEGNGIFSFPSAVKYNSFYLVIRHRNQMETWSKFPVYFTRNTSFDFTIP